MKVTLKESEIAHRSRRWEQVGAVGGILYVLLISLGDETLATGDIMPPPAASEQQITDYFAASVTTSFWVGRYIGLLSLCFLLIFVCSLWSALRRAEGEPSWLSAAAFGGGLLAVAFQFGGAPAQFAAVSRWEEGINPQLARALFDVGTTTFILSWFPLAVLLAATAVVANRTGALPRWIGWAAAVLAVGLLVGLAIVPSGWAFLPFSLCLLWFIAASVALIRRAGSPRDGWIALALTAVLVVGQMILPSVVSTI
jgi:hypothetical protein